MPYNPSGPGNLPVERIKPITAEWVGDVTAGGAANIQSFLDARRFIRAKVANLAARNALSAPQDGELVLVLDNGQAQTQLDRYKSSTASWVTVAVEGGQSGGGTGGGGSGAFKSPVRAATIVALPTHTRNANVLTASSNGVLPALDGVTMEADNRVLVKNETSAANNGIYVVTSVGSASTPWVLTRAEDANTDALVMPNMLVFVSEGTVNADTAFMLTTNASITLNTTALTFVRAMGGAGGVMGTPMLISETSNGSNLYNLPYTREHPMVWVDGSLQVKDIDFTVNAAGQVTFTPALTAGSTVIASCAVYPTTYAANAGGGAMSVPVVVTADAGTSNATYAVPGSGAEMVWKGGAIQVPGTDYTRSSNTITFVGGNIPAGGEEVVISVAAAPLVGTDATTLLGQTPEVTAAANSFAQRGADATLKASNHVSLGAAEASGTVIVADETGKVPAAAGTEAATASTVPVRGADGTLKAANHANLGAAGASGTLVALDANGKVPTVALPDTAARTAYRFEAMGDLASIVGTASPPGTGRIIDYVLVPANFTITAIDLLCPDAAPAGTITIDILRATTSGGAFTSLYVSNPKPSLTCAGGASFVTSTALPETTSIAAGTVLAVKLDGAPLGCHDLYVSIR